MDKVEGWKLVPVEPTPEMREAGAVRSGTFYDQVPLSVYAAMLEAAPTPPEQEDKPSFAEELSLPCPVCHGKGAGFYGRMAAKLSHRNDELRKAAEEFFKALDTCDLDAIGIAQNALRAALGKK